MNRPHPRRSARWSAAIWALLAAPLPAAEGPSSVLELRLDDPPEQEESIGAALDRWLSTAGIGVASREDLFHVLEVGGHDGVAVWLPHDSALSASLPPEPLLETPERLQDLDIEADPWRAVLALQQELIGRRVQLALGRSRPDDRQDVDRRIVWSGIGDRKTLSRRRRPGLERLLWFDLRWSAEQFDEHPASGSLESVAVRPLPPPLRRTQLLLDVALFRAGHEWDGRSELETEHRLLQELRIDSPEWFAPFPEAEGATLAVQSLLEQSELISAVARRIGGPEPHRLVAATNRWRGDRASGREVPNLRREPDALDLFEWAFSEASTAGAAPLVRDAAPSRPTLASFAPDVPLGLERSLPGLLSATDRAALARTLASREDGARALVHFLMQGDAGSQSAALDALRRSEHAAAALPASWRPDLADPAADAVSVRDLEPLRLIRREWKVFELNGEQRVFLGVDSTARIDDERFRSWTPWMLRERGLDRVEFASFQGGGAPGPWLLEADIPTTQARPARLDLEVEALVWVQLNGEAIVQRYDAHEAELGPLRASLPLAAGRNHLRIELQAERGLTSAKLTLTPLPRRLEGLHLTPGRASEVREPVVVLEHAMALGGKVLVIPERPRSTAAVSGSVEFILSPPRDQRVDVWVHGLALENRRGDLELRIDDDSPISLRLPPGDGWTWRRAPSPIRMAAGGHRLSLVFRERGVMVDSVVILETGTMFPSHPRGDASLHDSAWRYDPLGQGQRLDLQAVGIAQGARVFVPSKTQGYRVFAWMRGDRPLRGSDRCEIELRSAADTWRFNLPAGTAVEEWVDLGRLTFQADEPIEIRSRGSGRPAFLCFVP